MENWVLRRPCNYFEAPRVVYCFAWGPSGVALRRLRWSCLSGVVDLASEAVDNTA